MPVLICNDDPTRIFEWSDNTFVGRGLVHGLSFDRPDKSDREVSSMHAAITWNRKAAGWQVHDLGSVNGTSIGGQGVRPGSPRSIADGDVVHFGNSAWTVSACDAPAAAAVCRRGGEVQVAVDDLLLLPDERAPQKVITRARSNGEGETPGDGWMMYDWHEGWSEADPGEGVAHGQTIEADDRPWTLTLPEPAQGYATVRAVGPISGHTLILEVPANLENIAATLVRRDQRIRLAPRRHHELWWLLAKARLADGPTVDEAQRGWVINEALDRQLGNKGVGYLGVLIHRSRKQVSKAGFADYADIIERADGRVRIGLDAIEIVDA